MNLNSNNLIKHALQVSDSERYLTLSEFARNAFNKELSLIAFLQLEKFKDYKNYKNFYYKNKSKVKNDYVEVRGLTNSYLVEASYKLYNFKEGLTTQRAFNNFVFTNSVGIVWGIKYFGLKTYYFSRKKFFNFS